MTPIRIQIQTECFDVGAEESAIANGFNGATVVFVGRVRGNLAGDLLGLSIEHYAGLTENSLQSIAEDAASRWALQGITLIHRIGYLAVGEPIVLVAIASAHRSDAFFANQFIMDTLKTAAPFWKQEHFRHQPALWVEAKQSDVDAAAKWMQSAN